MTQHKMGLWKFVALSRQPINIVNNLVILIAAGSKISSQQTKIDGVKQILTDIKEKESSKKVRKCVITKESFWLIRKILKQHTTLVLDNILTRSHTIFSNLFSQLQKLQPSL